jgi:hypothetical protein
VMGVAGVGRSNGRRSSVLPYLNRLRPLPTVALATEPHRAQDPRLPSPGIVLEKRDRHGAVRCQCKVEEGGIRYAGTVYRSISSAAIAAAKDADSAPMPRREPSLIEDLRWRLPPPPCGFSRSLPERRRNPHVC